MAVQLMHKCVSTAEVISMHVMKAYMGNRCRAPPILNLSTRRR